MATSVDEIQLLCDLVQKEASAQASKQYPRVAEALQTVAENISEVLKHHSDNQSSFLAGDAEFEAVLAQINKEMSSLSVLLKDSEPVGFVKMVVHATVHREKLNRSSSRLNNLKQRRCLLGYSKFPSFRS